MSCEQVITSKGGNVDKTPYTAVLIHLACSPPGLDCKITSKIRLKCPATLMRMSAMMIFPQEIYETFVTSYVWISGDTVRLTKKKAIMTDDGYPCITASRTANSSFTTLRRKGFSLKKSIVNYVRNEVAIEFSNASKKPFSSCKQSCGPSASPPRP